MQTTTTPDMGRTRLSCSGICGRRKGRSSRMWFPSFAAYSCGESYGTRTIRDGRAVEKDRAGRASEVQASEQIGVRESDVAGVCGDAGVQAERVSEMGT